MKEKLYLVNTFLRPITVLSLCTQMAAAFLAINKALAQPRAAVVSQHHAKRHLPGA